MTPLPLTLRPGIPVYRQVVYSARKAIVSGRMKPGDRFPSVRALSKELKINPNTVQRVIRTLVDEGLLEVHPGIGTVVTRNRVFDRRERAALLGESLERLVVDARRVGLKLEDLNRAVEGHWRGTDPDLSNNEET